MLAEEMSAQPPGIPIAHVVYPTLHTFPGRVLQAVAGRHKLEAATCGQVLPGSRSSSRLLQPESFRTL